MKAINIKLATFSFAAMLLASCSDSNNILENGGTSPIKTIVGSAAVTSTTDAQELASRITNYKVQNTTASARTRAYTRVANNTTRPADAIDIREVIKLNRNWLEGGKNYYVPEGITVENGFNCSQWINNNVPANIYVEGTFKLNNSWGQGNIIVLKKGTLYASNTNEPFKEQNSIENHGTIIYDANQSQATIKQYVYNEGNMDLKDKDVKLTNNGNLAVTGNFEAKNLEVGSNCKFVSSCSANITGKAYFTNNCEVQFMYLKAGNITEDSGAKLYISPNSMMICDGRWINYNHGQGYLTLEEKGTAYIQAKEIEFNLPDNLKHKNNKGEVDEITCDMFRTSGNGANIVVNVVGDMFEQNVSSPLNKDIVKWNKNGNVILADDDEAKKLTIPATDCNNGGYNTEDPKPNKPTTDLIISVDYDHTHNISATGIMDLDGYLYMSYHTNQEQKDNADNSHGGCVEVLTPVKNNKVQLLQYLYDSQRVIDFNHLLAVELNNGEKKIFLPGNYKGKGAILSYMTINGNHMLATESKEITTSDVDKDGKPIVKIVEPLQYAQLHPATEEYKGKKYDENCVVYNKKKDHLIVATTEGYVVYDANTMNEVDKIERPGKVKHVAIGNGKIVGLYLDDKNHSSDDEVGATIEVINRDDEDFENSTKFKTTVGIKPNDGKNVVSVTDNLIYVCQSGLGLYVYNMKGEEQWHWQMPSAWNDKKKVYKALCNGCDVDDKYVYLAYGSYGLVVLDKNTHEVIAHRVASKSANYVKVRDNYIYVAYGRDRLQVYNLSTGAHTETNYQKK